MQRWEANRGAEVVNQNRHRQGDSFISTISHTPVAYHCCPHSTGPGRCATCSQTYGSSWVSIRCSSGRLDDRFALPLSRTLGRDRFLKYFFGSYLNWDFQILTCLWMLVSLSVVGNVGRVYTHWWSDWPILNLSSYSVEWVMKGSADK